MDQRDPYEVFDFAPDVDEAAIRARYLELVRRHPPDRDPERFAEVREAYDLLSDPFRRAKAKLDCWQTKDSLEAVLRDVRRQLRDARLPTDVLLSLAERP